MRPDDFREYEIIDAYVNATTYLRAIHKVCGNKISILPNSFISRGGGCKICSSERVRRNSLQPIEDFIKRIPPEITLIGAYDGMNQPVMVKCGLCGWEYKANPRTLVRMVNLGSAKGCTKCTKRYRRNIEDVKKEVSKESRGEYEVTSDKYINSHEHIKVKHKKCGHVYPVSRANFMYRGRRCPKCNLSIGETMVSDVLKDMNVKNTKDYE